VEKQPGTGAEACQEVLRITVACRKSALPSRADIPSGRPRTTTP
jgi:hypothetical protein